MNKTLIDDLLAKGLGQNEHGSVKLPGGVFMVAGLKKNSNYIKATGLRTMKPNGLPREIEADAVCFIASMTKLMTTIAAMQCVERGLIGLDDDISTALPSWKGAEILVGFDDNGKAVLKKAKNKITLRLLLCHASGIGYDLMQPDLIQWRANRGEQEKTMSGSVEGYQTPLLFEPGEGWAYGAGIDWAGKLVEALNGGIRLGDYMKKNIWDPLGMTSTAFNIESSNMKSRMTDMTIRIESGELGDIPDPIYPRDAVDDCGGIGCYSTAPDYMKVLLSLLHNDGKLLRSSSIDEMFKPQLPNPKFLWEVLEDPASRQSLAGPLPKSVKVNYGLGGIINMDPVPDGRTEGSMQWGGLPNLFWWIDRKTGLCATFFTQLLPTGDPELLEMVVGLEKAAYSGLGTGLKL